MIKTNKIAKLHPNVPELSFPFSNITGIRAFLHRTKFSGDHTYDQVADLIGPLKIDDDYNKLALKNGYSYKKKAWKRLDRGTLTFLFKTWEPYNLKVARNSRTRG